MVNLLWENFFKKDGQKSLVSTLKANPLFSTLSDHEIRLVKNIVNVREYQPGETIFTQNEVGVGMYIIVQGHVNIYTEEINPTNNEKQTALVTQLKSGEFFGELALVENEGRRSASASAQDSVQLIGFYKPDLLEIMERNPSAGVKILFNLGEILGLRLKQTTARISELKKEYAQNSHQ